MTRRHYRMVAAALAEGLDQASSQDERYAVRQVALKLANAFALDNPRFDRDGFLRAAGYYGAGILSGGPHE